MWKNFAFKISRDLLISSIITYFMLLVPELVLPGLISSHLDPQYLLIVIVSLGLIHSWLGKSYSKAENSRFAAISRNLVNIILFIVSVMLFLTLYKMKVWEILIVIALTLPLLICAEHILIKEK